MDKFPNRNTLHSLIEVCVYAKDKLLCTEIYFGGRLEPFEVIDCGILFGELLSNTYEITSPHMKHGNVDPDYLYNDYDNVEIFSSTEVAKFINSNSKLNQDSPYCIPDVLIGTSNTMYFNEFKTWCFIKDLLSYCQKEKIFLDINTLQWFMDLSSITIPKKRLVVLNNMNSFVKENDWLSEWSFRYNHEELFNTFYSQENMDKKKYIYKMDSVPEVALSLLYEIIHNGYTLKQCENCGKWFTPTKADEKYCIRISNNKTCKENANAKIRSETYNSDPNKKKYNSINTLLANRINKGNISKDEREKYQIELYKFRDEAIVWKRDVSVGTKSNDDYSTWLDSFKLAAKKSISVK